MLKPLDSTAGQNVQTVRLPRHMETPESHLSISSFRSFNELFDSIEPRLDYWRIQSANLLAPLVDFAAALRRL